MTARADINMCFFDFRPDCPRYLTYLSHEQYMRLEEPSPWAIMPGWHVLTCFHDLMHVIFLGLGRDLVANLLADWIDAGALGPGTMDQQLKALSMEMHAFFKREKKLEPVNVFNPHHAEDLSEEARPHHAQYWAEGFCKARAWVYV